MRPTRYFNWQRLQNRTNRQPAVVDSRRRVRLVLAAFVLLLAVVLGRLIQLEISQGADFRAAASRPIERKRLERGERGRILAADGTLLAFDRENRALAVHYRWIEEPADPAWLRWMARRRLAADQRGDPGRLTEAEAQVLDERQALARRVAKLTGVSADQWSRRADRISTRVRHIHDTVNHRRRETFDEAEATGSDADDSFWARTRAAAVDIMQSSTEPRQFEPIDVAEQHDYHVMIDAVSPEAVAAVESAPDRYPAVKIVTQRRRAYPQGTLAAHLLGHVGAVGPAELEANHAETTVYHAEDSVGRMGLELAYEAVLHGTPGVIVEQTDRGGRILATLEQRPPSGGRDLQLTLDVDLQRAAESLLRQALERRRIRLPGAREAGGAIVVLDVHTGAVLAAASAPAFDPNVFVSGDSAAVERLLEAPANPLFNRSIQMALPPGSVFKVATSVALLEEGAIRPGESMYCRGYLRSPDRLRCAVYRRHGEGHGDVTLSDALCQSCNVYFFHHAGRLGWTPIADWAWRLGFGHPTGIDLPREASGSLPLPTVVPEDGIDRQAELASVGQGELTATPIQVACLMAAVANDGRKVTPHVGSDVRLLPPEPIEGLSVETLSAIRAGLERTVTDLVGTAYDEAAGAGWAAKTGTAETGIDRQEHAWLAGYAPAQSPRVALVVVLEHAGNASESAVPVARRLVNHMAERGWLLGQ